MTQQEAILALINYAEKAVLRKDDIQDVAKALEAIGAFRTGNFSSTTKKDKEDGTTGDT